MNNCNFIGRLTRDPEVRYTQGDNPMCVARFSLAVDRNAKDKNGNILTDFPSFKALGKRGEFVEKYLKKGTKVGITARCETGSYEKDGQKVYFTEFLCEQFTFCDSKGAGSGDAQEGGTDEFMNVPEGTDEELPFN